jgi:ATP-binding cassette, subfamily C (CFTR/MRP), member 1
VLIGIAVTPTLLAPLLTFAIFAIEASARGKNGLSTVQAFTSLAIISLLTTPAQALLVSLPALQTALACFERIQTFLRAQQREDDRTENEPPFINFDRDETSIGLINLPSAQLGNETLRVQDLCIQPYQDSSFTLQSVSFKASRGSLNMIIGPVGSGKSTLLKAILRELKCKSGTIQTTSKRMAYCSQTPWLQNATVRQIISGGFDIEIDQDWYDTVVQACVLEEEILFLPDGHDTLIGSRGVTLSGGQKQRLVSKSIENGLFTAAIDCSIGFGSSCIRKTGNRSFR